MKLSNKILLSTIGISTFMCVAAQTTVYETYKKQKAAGEATIVPDFSYVGYEYGEKAIPNVNYKVFKVTDYGAIPNDNLSDKAAIQACINAAQANKSGIVYFPKGLYLVNEPGESETAIKITGNHIVLRGETGAVLFMREHMTATDPAKLWSTPDIIQFSAKKANTDTVTILADARIGSFEIKVSSTKNITPDSWVQINLQNNNPARVAQEVYPYQVSATWTDINERGVEVKTYHKVKSVSKTTITLADPIMYTITAKDNWNLTRWEPNTQCGVENLHFKGNFKEPFVHHLSAIHDGGWSILSVQGQANSWMKNCIFEDVNNAAGISGCANYTVVACKIIGNGGHAAISSYGSSRVLIAKCTDEASQWHAFGCAKLSINTVVWRCKNPPTNCFESHASQPRNTLVDCMVGGFLNTRDGGAIKCLPNHLQNLVLWNYTKTNDTEYKNMEFWDSTKPYFKMLMPVIAGFSGPNMSFDPKQLKYAEAIGGKTRPESLYEAQLQLRLGKLPQWIKDLKAE